VPGHLHLRSLARLVLAASLATASFGALAASPDATASALSRWTGGIDLYRTGVFTTQKTWLWCTAADVQIIRNIVSHRTDHSRANQQRYFDYMRAHNRYRIPVSDGIDPAGWTAGLRRFVDSRYRLVASRSFDSALRSAVTNLRKTNLPVGITVMHGNHAWIITGFTATADPAKTSRFMVTSVRVVGPLWGLQNRTYGYDMQPDKKLTPAQLKGFFTPWHYAPIKMAWENRWVSIQPVPTRTSAPAQAPAPTKTAAPKPTPAAAASSSSPSAAPASAAPASSAAAVASSGPGTIVPASKDPATAVGGSGAGPSPAATSDSSVPSSARPPVDLSAGLGLLVVALAVVGGFALGLRRRT
jgi:hypothetical protein